MGSVSLPLKKLLIETYGLVRPFSRLTFPRSNACTLCHMGSNDSKSSSCSRNGSGNRNHFSPHGDQLKAVGASTEPPANVLPAFNKDVLISLVKDKSAADKTPTVAQWLAHLERKNISAVTLLMLHLHRLLLILGCLLRKTLGNATRIYKGAAISNGASNSKQYDALVDKLTSDVQGTLSQNCGAEFAADSSRIHKLETDMEEIKAHNATFRSWFKETGTRLANQDEQLAHLHTAVQQQQFVHSLSQWTFAGIGF